MHLKRRKGSATPVAIGLVILVSLILTTLAANYLFSAATVASPPVPEAPPIVNISVYPASGGAKVVVENEGVSSVYLSTLTLNTNFGVIVLDLENLEIGAGPITSAWIETIDGNILEYRNVVNPNERLIILLNVPATQIVNATVNSIDGVIFSTSAGATEVTGSITEVPGAAVLKLVPLSSAALIPALTVQASGVEVQSGEPVFAPIPLVRWSTAWAPGYLYTNDFTGLFSVVGSNQTVLSTGFLQAVAKVESYPVSRPWLIYTPLYYEVNGKYYMPGAVLYGEANRFEYIRIGRWWYLLTITYTYSTPWTNALNFDLTGYSTVSLDAGWYEGGIECIGFYACENELHQYTGDLADVDSSWYSSFESVLIYPKFIGYDANGNPIIGNVEDPLSPFTLTTYPLLFIEDPDYPSVVSAVDYDGDGVSELVFDTSSVTPDSLGEGTAVAIFKFDYNAPIPYSSMLTDEMDGIAIIGINIEYSIDANVSYNGNVNVNKPLMYILLMVPVVHGSAISYLPVAVPIALSDVSGSVRLTNTAEVAIRTGMPIYGMNVSGLSIEPYLVIVDSHPNGGVTVALEDADISITTTLVYLQGTLG